MEELIKVVASVSTERPPITRKDAAINEPNQIQCLESKLQMLHFENGQLREQREQLTYILNSLRLEVSRLNLDLVT